MKTVALAALAALVLPAAAFAHAHVSPPVGLKGESQVYTLAVPTEKEGAETTQIEFTPPAGFNIDSFVAAPGWTRKVDQTGSGENATITKVTWSGGSVPTGEATGFSFLASPADAKTYTFGVRQTYSDGSVVDWNGPESSDTPAPTVEALSSLGGGGGTSTLEIVALVLAIAALVIAVIGLVGGKGSRSLT